MAMHARMAAPVCDCSCCIDHVCRSPLYCVGKLEYMVVVCGIAVATVFFGFLCYLYQHKLACFRPSTPKPPFSWATEQQQQQQQQKVAMSHNNDKPPLPGKPPLAQGFPYPWTHFDVEASCATTIPVGFDPNRKRSTFTTVTTITSDTDNSSCAGDCDPSRAE
ncbi:hypothetical protein DIPPA_23796 [Diplonema papillatum]|nr:hypothetical protein DIPPA_23796 [Diplonema papillatum]